MGTLLFQNFIVCLARGAIRATLLEKLVSKTGDVRERQMQIVEKSA